MESELAALAAEVGFVGGEVRARFASFAGTSAETRVSGDLRLGAVTFTARRAA